MSGQAAIRKALVSGCADGPGVYAALSGEPIAGARQRVLEQAAAEQGGCDRQRQAKYRAGTGRQRTVQAQRLRQQLARRCIAGSSR